MVITLKTPRILTPHGNSAILVRVKTIPLTHSKAGYEFKQVFRERDVAIFEQKRPGAGEAVAFEVIKIKVRPPNPHFKINQPYEAYPSSESWGALGWTCLTWERAREKAAELLH